MEESVNFLTFYKETFGLKRADAATYSPLVLAYIGDAVYELMIRTKIVNDGNMQVNKLHKKSAGLVKAETQANLIKLLLPHLTEEELAVAKHATMTDYRMATGFEALIGWLFLAERFQRLTELTALGLREIGELT